MTRSARLLALAPALALLSACDGLPTGGSRVCPAVVVPSLEVEVVDAATGANLAGDAEGWWVTGDQAGPLMDLHVPSRFLTAYGPAGRYGVIVQHAGYAPWGRDDVRVERGECGPKTVSLRAELVRDASVPSIGQMPRD